MTGEANVCIVQPNDDQHIATLEDDSHFSVVTSFLDGFIACAHQTIRYLIEVEGLPTDHPLVTGLEDHLYMKIQEAMQLINLMSVTNDLNDSSESENELFTETDTLTALEDMTDITETDSAYNSSMDECVVSECTDKSSINESNLVTASKNESS